MKHSALLLISVAMYHVYILRSTSTKSYYIGHCKDLVVRLSRHNSGRVRSTKSKMPWIVVYTEKFLTKNQAYKREMQIKKYKGGDAFKKLIGIL